MLKGPAAFTLHLITALKVEEMQLPLRRLESEQQLLPPVQCSSAVIAPLPARVGYTCASVSSSQILPFQLNVRRFSSTTTVSYHCIEIKAQPHCSRVPSSTLSSGYCLCAVPYLLVSLWISTKFSHFLPKPFFLFYWRYPSRLEDFHLPTRRTSSGSYVMRCLMMMDDFMNYSGGVLFLSTGNLRIRPQLSV